MQRLTLALPGNEDLARGIAQACGSEAGRIETRRFPMARAMSGCMANLPIGSWM